MRKAGTFGSNFEIFCVSQLLQKHIEIFQNDLIETTTNPIIVHPVFFEDPENCSKEEDTIKIFYNRRGGAYITKMFLFK